MRKMSIQENIEWLFERCSYIRLEDSFRDNTTGYLICKNREFCGKAVDREDKFCRSCGVADPVSRAHNDPELRFRVVASTHGICYPRMRSGQTWTEALELMVAELAGTES